MRKIPLLLGVLALGIFLVLAALLYPRTHPPTAKAFVPVVRKSARTAGEPKRVLAVHTSPTRKASTKSTRAR